ncbi:hypothetical protein CcCBS67573_g01272 [Chytriomyces confervae]|uniref:Cilia- and flagella-associated protein 69 ARM repeats domain-containing protein n=1 Tax=Chytriomyces confervae TaxID=246404 RepID=A0A507FP57_9FUNG|nr:hypothetical protein HDU80_000980 [Chytriomyces hyalinus]TPX77460.1 hypothetical protein CcCBS67573_g01272 [Chytriomyces confervae]
MNTIVPSFAPLDGAADFDKICAVFTGKHTATMFDRHAAILDKLARIYKDGFHCRDLNNLARVLTLAFGKISLSDNDPSFLHSLENLVAISHAPFLESGHNDTPADYIAAFAVSLAKLTNTRHVKISEAAAEAIYNIAGGRTPSELVKPTKRLYARQKCLKEAATTKLLERQASLEREIHFIQIEKSDTLDELMHSLETQREPRIVQAILKIIRKLSYSPISARKLSNASNVSRLVDLMYCMQDDTAFSIIVEIFWNLLSSKEKQSVANVMVQQGLNNFRTHGKSILSELFEICSSKTSVSRLKSTRNEFIIILNSLISLAPACLPGFFESNFTESIGHCMMRHELGGLQDLMRISAVDTAAPLKKPFIFTSSPEDYEFKKMLMQISMQLCSHEGNLTLLLEQGLLDFLLLYLESDCNNDAVNIWNDVQLKELQLQTLQFLNAIVPRIPQYWSAVNGNALLLNYLSKSMAQITSTKPDLVSSPTSHLATTATVENQQPAGLVKNPSNSLVGGTLRLVSRISELGPSQKRALGAQGAFKVLIAILTDPEQRVDTWRAAFLICSSLCQGCKSNKVLFGESGGVDMILPYLTYSSADPQETEAVLLAAVECVWGSVCGSATNEAAFFSADGIFALMDLIPNASYTSQRHILGCLLDLLENPKARSHVLEWRSSKNEQTGVAHLLIALWNSEERRLGVPSGAFGTLADERKPLAGHNQLVHNEPVKDGYVVEELSENLRAKIYSMFCKLGFDHFYSIISPEEQIKLTLIAKYLDFKIGQVWEEISQELEYEGIRPISPDLDCIKTATQVIVDKARAIKQKQNEIIQRKTECENHEEDEFYGTYIKQRGIPIDQ